MRKQVVSKLEDEIQQLKKCEDIANLELDDNPEEKMVEIIHSLQAAVNDNFKIRMAEIKDIKLKLNKIAQNYSLSKKLQNILL